MAIYLGFDSSTQGLTATAIRIDGSSRSVVFERSIDYDTTLPHYATRHGVLSDTDPLVACAPPLMWAEALDRMMAGIAESGIDLSDIRAISGSAQQHGTVYLAQGAGDRLARFDPGRPLVEGLRGLFSRSVSPIWMDSSTGTECAAITESIGGAATLASLTGSRAFERFSGPQIRKFARVDADGYARTERIHLVSSFLASLLAGRHAPIDPGDGSGMNLMDIAAKTWAPAALRATAPDLAAKLPPIRESWTIAGPLAPYWTRRYGFPAAQVVIWSGDNPCSLIGVGLIKEGRVAISLGTSDTLFAYMSTSGADPSGAGHVFGSPTGAYMGITVFKNGSLARERVRDEHGLDWTGFSAALAHTPPGNQGAIMLPWFAAEITPPIMSPGVRRYALDPSDAAANVRAVVESQMLGMAAHSRWMGGPIATIHATGGAAVNREILVVMSDVFGADVYQLDVANSAALGAALRAYHADLASKGTPASWDEVIRGFVEPAAATVVRPRPEHHAMYVELARVRAACEAHALGNGPDPSPLIAAFRKS
jgi:xylulokinase